VRSAHHHPFHHGLAADEGFLAAFQYGQHLNVREQAEKCSEGQIGNPLRVTPIIPQV
jgi:hypothetical protein